MLPDIAYPPDQNKKNGTLTGFARVITLLASSIVSILILILPKLMTGSNHEVNHNALMLLLWGVSAGFVYGVGFKPQHKLLKIMFHPLVAWPSMILACSWLWL